MKLVTKQYIISHYTSQSVGWGLTALVAQTGYIVPQRKLQFTDVISDR